MSIPLAVQQRFGFSCQDPIWDAELPLRATQVPARCFGMWLHLGTLQEHRGQRKSGPGGLMEPLKAAGQGGQGQGGKGGAGKQPGGKQEDGFALGRGGGTMEEVSKGLVSWGMK